MKHYKCLYLNLILCLALANMACGNKVESGNTPGGPDSTQPGSNLPPGTKTPEILGTAEVTSGQKITLTAEVTNAAAADDGEEEFYFFM